jgi:hypothetical protein
MCPGTLTNVSPVPRLVAHVGVFTFSPLSPHLVCANRCERRHSDIDVKKFPSARPFRWRLACTQTGEW